MSETMAKKTVLEQGFESVENFLALCKDVPFFLKNVITNCALFCAFKTLSKEVQE